MKASITYPKILDAVFEKLYAHQASPIIIGGFVRDSLLGRASKDIDIEVYKISSYENLENILAEFGSVSTVGKSFGVCKLFLEDLDLDFTLPRLEKKIAPGHKGFEVCIDADLEFTQATSRRDFTINAIGYDVQTKKILDPFGGRVDLKNKILRVVDERTFGEDPLRVMRALQFCARFELDVDAQFFTLAQSMIAQKILDELVAQRVFEELKKLLLRAKNPSRGLILLRRLDPFKYFAPLTQIDTKSYEEMLRRIDYLAQIQDLKEEKKLILSLGVLSYPLCDTKERNSFLQTLTEQKDIQLGVLSLLAHYRELESLLVRRYTNSDLYHLATKVCIEELALFVEVLRFDLEPTTQALLSLKQRAQDLGVYQKALPPLIQGRDLISLGLKPSKKFKEILGDIYEAQMDDSFSTHQEALLWLQRYLSSIE